MLTNDVSKTVEAHVLDGERVQCRMGACLGVQGFDGHHSCMRMATMTQAMVLRNTCMHVFALGQQKRDSQTMDRQVYPYRMHNQRKEHPQRHATNHMEGIGADTKHSELGAEGMHIKRGVLYDLLTQQGRITERQPQG